MSGVRVVNKETEYSVEEIRQQLNEPRPLPIGRAEMEEWTDRIIAGACLPATVTRRSLQFILVSEIMRLGPTESHKPDGYFIHVLRKYASNQVADTFFRELKAQQEAEWKAEQAKLEAEKVSQAERDALLARGEPN